jgi:hypothetical protein
LRVLAFVIFLFLGQWASAQATIKIVDKDTKEVLIGAYVVVNTETDTFAISTDESGRFEIDSENLPANLDISYLGYEALNYELTGQSSEEVTIGLQIDELNIAVNPIIIANPFLSNDISFNRKEFQVLPGAYEDPSRLLLKAPGFSTANDQANSILFKGMPSNFVNWSVNGSMIVNPNHLSNAGTLSDISSANAGGVNMMSGQVIGTYDFQSAPYLTPSNNAIAGNSNVEFSNYNNNYLNLSLVGLEAGLAYKGVQVNYRYSTVGILTGVLGLDFGGEDIVYQDLFAKFDIINKPQEKLSGHLVLGRSHNYKDAVMSIDSAETFKDIQNIYFDSDIILSGLRYKNTKGRFNVNANLNFSAKQDMWVASDILSDFTRETNIDQQVISGILEVKNKGVSFGVNAHYIDENRTDLVSRQDVLSSSIKDQNNFNLMPFANVEYVMGRFYFLVGSGLTYNSITQDFNFEPNAKVIASISNDFEAELAHRRNTQILNATSFSYGFDPDEIVGEHTEAYLRYKKQKYTIYVNAFAHFMSNILVDTESNYSQYTGLDHPGIRSYTFDGTASSIGFSAGLSTKDLWLEGLSFSANVTSFDSKFGKNGENDLDNTFDFGQSFNLVGSYNRKMKNDKDFVISLSYHQRGGLNEFDSSPIIRNGIPIASYDFNGTTMSTLQDYTRVDFRLVYNLRKGSQRKFAKSFSLDIQNIANRENDAFTNFDFLTNEPFVQKQLGLIPILAYRIEF